MQAQKIGIGEARRHLDQGDALLVCAYDSDEKFASNHLQGAWSLAELHDEEDRVSRDREIIFYCA